MHKILLLFIIFNLPFITETSWASLRSKVNKGNNYYNQKKFEKALQLYRDAQIDSPESPEVHFNIGNGLYKTNKYEESMKGYEKATYSKEPIPQSKAYYNMGNCLYRQGKG